MKSFQSLLLCVAGISGVARAGYTLTETYDTTNFFSSFDFFSGTDPTNGFVTYVDAAEANQRGLAGYSQGGIYLGVDYQNNSASVGRASVRVSSKKTYTKGLFILDVAHMPASVCGAWPAFWSFGPNWPSSGEIDIIEGVNSNVANIVTLHTSDGCNMSNNGSLASTKLDRPSCKGNQGCAQKTVSTNNYGTGLNRAKGGVYAMEWSSSAISVWHFPSNSSVAVKIKRAQSVDTASFGTPLAQFSGSGCDIDKHFMNHQLVFDTTFCGDWAGDDDIWRADETCSKLAPTCKDYVANNAEAFSEAYWTIKSLKVYTPTNGGAATARRAAAFTA